MKFFTPVSIEAPRRPVSLSDTIMVLGSCFADTMGRRMAEAGFNVCVNPFGTLYNPLSIERAVQRLSNPVPFGPEDCVEMGAGAGLVCSFDHHTSFARRTPGEFLENANRSLEEASRFWKKCNLVIVTPGTAFVWYTNTPGGERAVANCLKRPGTEFTHRLLGLEEATLALQSAMRTAEGKDFIFTVSPIRHLGDGARANSLSKARLLLAVESCPGAGYFPAFEIFNDELRDYRFYAGDLVHPSAEAAGYVWERFLDSFVPESELPAIKDNEKAARRAAHRSILKD